MKAFLVSFFMVFAAYPMAFAGTLSCQGPVWVSSVFFPIPLKRLADVIVTNRQTADLADVALSEAPNNQQRSHTR